MVARRRAVAAWATAITVVTRAVDSMDPRRLRHVTIALVASRRAPTRSLEAPVVASAALAALGTRPPNPPSPS